MVRIKVPRKYGVQREIELERSRQNADFNRRLKNAEDSMKAIYPEEYKKIRSKYFGNGNNLGLIGSQYNYIHDMITRRSDDQMKKYYNELNDYFIKQTGTQPGYMLPGVDVNEEAPDWVALRQNDFNRFYSPTENSDYLNSVEKENARNAYLALQNKNSDGTFDHDGYFDYNPNNGLLNTEANYARAQGSYNYTPEERKAAATWERAQNSPIVTAMEFSPLFPVVAGVKAAIASEAPQTSGVDVGMNAAFAALPAIGAGTKAINNTRKLIRKPPQITRLALNSDDRFIQGQNLSRSLDKTSIAPNVDAHGISKGNELERLEAILSKGIDKNKKFFSAPLAKAEGVDNIGQALGTSGGTAYTDGMFILASKPNKYLIDDGIDAVLINIADTKYAKELKKYLTHKYPNTKFLTYEEAPKYYGAKWNPIEEIKNTDNAEKLSQPIQYGSVGDELPPPPDEINYFFKSGGIHINPKNEGKFTESANRAGMGVQEYARHILANKENYSPTMVRRANFARNASKWKHDDGGSTIGDRNRGNERQRNEFEQMSSLRRDVSPENEEVVNVDDAHEWKRIHWGEYDKSPTGNKMYGDVYTINRPESYDTVSKKRELKRQIREEFPNAIIHENRPYMFKKYLFGENRGDYKPIYIDSFRVPSEEYDIDYELPQIGNYIQEISKPTIKKSHRDYYEYLPEKIINTTPYRLDIELYNKYKNMSDDEKRMLLYKNGDGNIYDEFLFDKAIVNKFGDSAWDNNVYEQINNKNIPLINGKYDFPLKEGDIIETNKGTGYVDKNNEIIYLNPEEIRFMREHDTPDSYVIHHVFRQKPEVTINDNAIKRNIYLKEMNEANKLANLINNYDNGGVLDSTYREQINRIIQPRYKVRIIEP